LKTVVGFLNAAPTSTRSNGAKNHYASITLNSFETWDREIMEEVELLKKCSYIHHSHETI